ncbi:MAG: hypothetical protein JAY63_13075 [Candidatus Thiodiazotropha taylori]|nr:hypothetical protein [Candidatus Thiodiazotropha taylori]
MLIDVDTWMPTFIPLRYDSPEAVDEINRNRRDFFNQLKGVFVKLCPNLVHIEIGTSIPNEKALKLLSDRSFISGLNVCEYYLLHARVEVDLSDIRMSDGSKVEDIFYYGEAIECVNDALSEALILSEIAYPGSIAVLDRLSLANDQARFYGRKDTFYSLLVPEEFTPSWPPLEKFPLESVYYWSKEHSFFEQAYGCTRISRALAAFSHVVGLGASREGEVLFRAMQGLEAFYSDGTGDLRRQLSEKIEIWLGEWPEKKNIIGHLYDARSKFVHGSSPLIYWNVKNDPWKEDKKSRYKFEYSMELSVRLLIATLQECIKGAVNEINWTYSVETLKFDRTGL